MKYNYQKLLGAMREKGFSQESLARTMHISPASLNLKLNNKREFRQSEMQQIFDALELPIGSISKYFFTH